MPERIIWFYVADIFHTPPPKKTANDKIINDRQSDIYSKESLTLLYEQQFESLKYT